MSHFINDEILDNLSVEVGFMTIAVFIAEHTDTANAIANTPYNSHLKDSLRARSTAVARIASNVVHGAYSGFPEAKASFYKATWDDVVDYLDAKWNKLTEAEEWGARELLAKDIDVMREAFHDIVDYKFDQLEG